MISHAYRLKEDFLWAGVHLGTWQKDPVFWLNVSLMQKFYLLLLCVHNGFHSRSSGATHTHYIFSSPHSFCSLFSLPSPTNKVTPTQKYVWTHALTHKRAHTHSDSNWPSAAATLIALHSNKTDDFPRQISVGRTELLALPLPAISSTNTRLEINDLSVCQSGVGLGLIQAHKAHSQERGTPPLSVERWCNTALIRHMHPHTQLNTCWIFRLLLSTMRWKSKKGNL